MKPPRLMVFVIAYYAESTLRRVLERIPTSVFTNFDVEVVVIDDASDDRTFEIGLEYREANPGRRVKVLRNEYNQGYGGNQKVGYAYAIAEGFDFVAMVHGDGQYAPEELPRMLEPLTSGRADAVFGSRMTTRTGALRGGMPLYKFVGNRILTTLQNALLGVKLSEFHSGYRAYSVKALAQLPFRLNTDDFHFDTEIILQLLNARARLVEVPIPTFYGTEISRVNGLAYAKNVMTATVQNALHRAGVFYQRRFDTEPPGPTHYDAKLGYASTHTWAVESVREGSTVLDVGAGSPAVEAALLGRGCQVAVVVRDKPAAPVANVDTYVCDLNGEFSVPLERFDTVLMLDVIEHLSSPEAFLQGVRAKVGHQPKHVVLSTANVGFFPVRVMLMLGQFNYGRRGVLDMTHTRLFTFRSIQRLLADEGYRVTKVRGVPAPFPMVLGEGVVGRTALALNEALIRVSRTLFSFQVYVEAETTPTVEYVLSHTRHQSAVRESAPRP